MRTLTALFVAAVTLAPPPASACMWDYDTLQMERSRFPDALELVTGKFLRHSEDYYRWRVQDRLARIETDPSDPRLYDDLAVAYDKLGQHDRAIETIRRVEAIVPDRYETEANLGTFLVHSGDFEQGLVHLRRAVEINPDAHFGREVYQILLVEYVLSKRAEDGTVPRPLAPATDEGPSFGGRGFAKFVLEQQGIPEEDADARKAELTKALKGVLGMMRFGNHESPVLLEAAGDLLGTDWNEDGKRLATRAYLKAALDAEDEPTRAAFRKQAKAALNMQVVSRRNSDQLSLAAVERRLQSELDEARTWYAEVAANERRWIDEGADVDAKFTATYYEEPEVGRTGGGVDLAGIPLPWKIAIGVVLLLAVVAVFMLRWRQTDLLSQSEK